jgi:hypothetical protein
VIKYPRSTGSTGNGQERKNQNLITRMTNSALAFLSCVFILKESEGYRLILIQDRVKLFDSRYKTLRGARLACTILTRKRMYKSGIKPDWSFFYPVDEKWLHDNLNKRIQVK